MDSEFKARHARLIADFDPTGEMGWAEFHSKLLPMLTNKEALAGGHFKYAIQSGGLMLQKLFTPL